MNLAMNGDISLSEATTLTAPLRRKLTSINSDIGALGRQTMARDLAATVAIPPVQTVAEFTNMANQYVFAMVGQLCHRGVVTPTDQSKGRVATLTNQLAAAQGEVDMLKATNQRLVNDGHLEFQNARKLVEDLRQQLVNQCTVTQQLQQQLNTLRQQVTTTQATPQGPSSASDELPEAHMTDLTNPSPRKQRPKRNSTEAGITSPQSKAPDHPTARVEEAERGGGRHPHPTPLTYAAAVGKPTRETGATTEGPRDLLKHVKRFNTAMPPNDPRKDDKEIDVRVIQVSEKYHTADPTELKEVGVQLVVKAGLKNVRNVHCMVSRNSKQILLFMDKADSRDNVSKLGAMRIRAPRFSFLRGISDKTPQKALDALAKRMGYLLARTDYGPMRKAIRVDLRKYQEEEEGVFRDLVAAVDDCEEEFRKSWKPRPRRC
jgi:polyhydroxyalkanoate synthesis regulator phasin